MEIYLSTRENKCSDKIRVKITSGNIIIDKGYYNYEYDIHNDYLKFSKDHHPENLVNTRFKLVNGTYYYSYLNYFQKSWLLYRKITLDHVYKTVIALVAIVTISWNIWKTESVQRENEHIIKSIDLLKKDLYNMDKKVAEKFERKPSAKTK